MAVGCGEESFEGMPEERGGLGTGHPSGADFLSCRVAQCRGSRDDPGGGKIGVEVTVALAPADKLLEHVEHGLVPPLLVIRVGRLACRGQQERFGVEDLPADLNQPQESLPRRAVVEVGRLERGGDPAGGSIRQRADEGAARREVRVDGLSSQARRVGDVLEARMRVLAEDSARRVEDRGDAAFRVGPTSAPAGAVRTS